MFDAEKRGLDWVRARKTWSETWPGPATPRSADGRNPSHVGLDAAVEGLRVRLYKGRQGSALIARLEMTAARALERAAEERRQQTAEIEAADVPQSRTIDVSGRRVDRAGVSAPPARRKRRAPASVAGPLRSAAALLAIRARMLDRERSA